MSTPVEFMGYPRNAGSAGIRNHLLILPTVICANQVAQLISQTVARAAALQHPFGCSQIGNDVDQTYRTLVGMGANANVGGVIIVGLGCETISGEDLAESIASFGKPVELVQIQACGGSDRTFQAGARLARQLSQKLAKTKREPCSLSQLTVGIHCADLDDSVISLANPVIGKACDMLIATQARVVLSEMPELLKVSEELQAKAETLPLANAIRRVLLAWQERLTYGDRRISHLPPGGGPVLPTRCESLGSLAKAGQEPIKEVLAYGQRPQMAGLALMDTPSTPVESITGMVAGGAQLVMLATGSGIPLGSPVAPVISISASTKAVALLEEHVDLDLTFLQPNSRSFKDAVMELLDRIKQIAGGQQTKTERLGYRDFAINRIGPTV
ncbi:MAG: UxaA family hydrolase [Firmicutes bacterium]|nr:UxaA family hydrolase [Bacillota bacterium]